jgi:hypothetical protein
MISKLRPGPVTRLPLVSRPGSPVPGVSDLPDP